VSVLLSGIGGDSVVSHGVAYLTELAGSGHPGRFLAEARALARRHHRPLAHVVQKYGLRPFAPPAVVRARRALRGRDFGIAGVVAPVRADVVAGLRLEERAADRGVPRPPPRTARLAHLAELTAGFSPYALEVSFHTDAVVGVQRRYPFLDRRLAELCLSLPGDQKLRDGWTRSIMRRALAGVLPEVVRLRPGKADLSDPLVRGLLGADRVALDALVACPGAVAEWVDPAALTSLWHRCLADRRADDCFILWRVAVLARWLDHHGLA
jgi:asparagine synthase (glutamine-hydrolysing)